MNPLRIFDLAIQDSVEAAVRGRWILCTYRLSALEAVGIVGCGLVGLGSLSDPDHEAKTHHDDEEKQAEEQGLGNKTTKNLNTVFHDISNVIGLLSPGGEGAIDEDAISVINDRSSRCLIAFLLPYVSPF